MAAAGSRNEIRRKIVDEAARLLQEQGPEAVTTRGVAEAAGIQAPTIYRLFGDKDGLLEAVAEHVMATHVTMKSAMAHAATVDECDPIEDLRASWQRQIDFGLANAALFHLLSDPDRAQRSPAAQSGRNILAARVHRIAVTGRLRVSEERAVGLIHAAGMGVVQALLSTPPEQRDVAVADTMCEAVFQQILTEAPKPNHDHGIAAAISLRATAAQLDILSDAERRLLTEWLDRVIDSLAQPDG